MSLFRREMNKPALVAKARHKRKSLSRHNADEEYPEKESHIAADSDSDRPSYLHDAVYDSGGNIVAQEYNGQIYVECPRHTTEKKLVAKIDARVMPVLCVIYLLAFLDRVNIGNAAVFNLIQDLDLQGTQFNTALTIFFVPYCLLEIPSNVFLKRFKPHVWLSVCMFGFGLVSICQGLVSSYGGLLTARFFLGVFESGMFPGCQYLISMWYKRTEAQKRYSFFFNSTTLAGAFGGLLASAIGLMSGLRGYSGWRWIFILEGTLTCVVAIVVFFLIADFPEDAKWLKEDERAFVKARLHVDQGKSALDRIITFKDVINVFKDFKIIVGGFMYLGFVLPGYSYAYFAPTIIENFGYSPIETQLHSVPPWAAAFVFSLIIAYISDTVRHRYGFVIFSAGVGSAGFAMLLGLNGHLHAEYAALFLVTCGTLTLAPLVLCWFQMNLGGHHRRAVGTGWQVGFGNIGGIIAPYAFISTEGPRYITGYSVCIAFCCLSAVASTIYLISCMVQNKHRSKTPVDVGLAEFEKTEMGDMNPEYRYQL